MVRVNISVPDDLLGQAKAAGLNVSRLAAAALVQELERRAKVAELDAYVAELDAYVAELDAYVADLDAEFGPIPQEESVVAREWAEQVLSASSRGTKERAHGVTIILDAGGVNALAGQRARLVELRRRGYWLAQVPGCAPAQAGPARSRPPTRSS